MKSKKKWRIRIIYIIYLLLIGFATSIACFAILEPKPTLMDLYDPNFKPKGNTIFQKLDNDVLPYALGVNVSKWYKNVYFKTNSGGFRDREYSINKGNSTRIIMLGDSFTFGHMLPINHTFVKMLEQLLNNTEVLNFGISGYNTKLEVKLLKDKIKYKPDIVILMYYLNDPDRILQNFSLGKNGNEITNAVNAYFTTRENKTVEKFLKEQGCINRFEAIKGQIGLGPVDYYKQLHCLPIFWDSVKKSFDELENLSIANNFSVIVAILPSLEFAWEYYPYLNIHEQVISEASSHGFRVLDLYPALSKYEHNSLRLPKRDIHTNTFANKVIAQELYSFLTKP